MKKIIGILLVLVMMVVSYSFAAGSNYELAILWSSDKTEKVDPLYALDSEAYKTDRGIVFIEEYSSEDVNENLGVLYSKVKLLDKDGNLIAEKTLGDTHFSTVFRVYDNYVFYVEMECDEDGYNCFGEVGVLSSDLKSVMAKEIKVVAEANDLDVVDIYYSFANYGGYDINMIRNVAKDKDGNYIFYSTKDEFVKISVTSQTIELITLTDEEIETYFLDVNHISEKNYTDRSKNIDYNSYIKLNDGSILYTGTYNSGVTAIASGTPSVDIDEIAYLEVVKDGAVVWSKEDSKYDSFSSPIIVKDYIVVKATYDNGNGVGSKKADLIMYTMNGEHVNTLSSKSYFNTLISMGDYFITDEVYVEGSCLVDDYGTYDLWNAESCVTYRFYRIIEPKPISVIPENPETKALSILLLIIIAIGLGFFIKNNIVRMREN